MKLTILIILTGFAVLAFLFTSCNNKMGKANANDDFEVTYSKSRGKSKTRPHYSIEIKGNTVNFKGVANVPVIGLKIFEISNAQLMAIRGAFEKSGFAGYDEVYMGRMRDFPIMRMSYKGHDVKCQQGEGPEELAELAKMLDALIPAK